MHGQIRAISVRSPWWALALLPLLTGFYGARAFAVGVFLVIPAAGVVTAILEKRSRKSVLHADRWPISIGQRLSGYVEADFDRPPEQGFWLVLRCTEPDLSSENNALLTLWQDELTIAATDVKGSARRVRIPFSFEMPVEGKASGGGVKWGFLISSRGYEAGFELPVVRSSVPPVISDERTRIFATVRDSLRR